MAAKKNKKAKKPAVGKPAAGSNNKREKNNSQQPQNKNQNNSNKANSQKKQIKQNPPVQKNFLNAVDEKAKKQAPKKEKPVKKAPEKQKKPTKKTETESKKINSVFSEIIKKEQNTVATIEKFKKEYNMRKVAAAAGIAVVFVAVIITLFVSLLGSNYKVPDYIKDIEYKGRVEPESIAYSIDISENQQKALAKATKSKGDKRAFDFFVNDDIVMDEYDEPALLEFGSVDYNDCVLLFFIFDENGNEIYRSLGIEPGKQVKSVLFFDEIPYGSHEATLAVIGYDKDTHKRVGMQTTKIKLEIGVE